MASHTVPLMHPVESSTIAAVGFSRKTATLTIRFHRSGAVYTYDPVPEGVYRRFLHAPSKGAFFHAHIRNAPTIHAKEVLSQ